MICIQNFNYYLLQTKKRPDQVSEGSEEDEMVAERQKRREKVVSKKRRDRELDEQVPARLRGKSAFIYLLFVAR